MRQSLKETYKLTYLGLFPLWKSSGRKGRGMKMDENRKNRTGKKTGRVRRGWCAVLAALLVLGVLGCAGCGRGAEMKSFGNMLVAKAKTPAKKDGSTVDTGSEGKGSFYDGLEEFGVRTAVEFAQGKQGENLIYSPFSLYLALALTAQGAVGETQEELLEFLGAQELGADGLAQALGELYEELYYEDERSSFRIANSLWMAQEWNGGKLSYQKPFLETATDQFYASLFSADFTDEATGKAQGEWVAEQTGGLLHPEFPVSEDQILSILNTIYLKDEWETQFHEGSVETAPFRLTDGSSKDAEFLRGSRSGMAAQGDGFTRASLALAWNGEVVFILPDEGVSPEELMAGPERLGEVLGGGEEFDADVIWKLPKFSFSMEETLTDMVMGMGVEKAFGDEADFSDMVKFSDPGAFAYISLIRQGAKFTLDENGIEAAAFTEVAMAAGTSAPMPEEKPEIEMKLDRPFLYAVYEGDVLVFLGVCQDPCVE